MSQSFEGKVAVVTGGSSGIGFAAARKLAHEGARVIIFGRREDVLAKAVAAIGSNVRAVTGDVATEGDLDRLYDEIMAVEGRVDIVIANAAVIEAQPLGQITQDALNHQFAVNVSGIVFTVQKALPLLSKGASVVLMGSVASSKAQLGGSIYAATKAAIRTLARGWALELKDRGIRVNVVSPGATDTEGFRDFIPSEHAPAVIEQIAAGTPSGRIGKPEEIANVVAFLASDAGSYVNGADFQADGGYAQI